MVDNRIGIMILRLIQICRMNGRFIQINHWIVMRFRLTISADQTVSVPISIVARYFVAQQNW